MMTIRAAEDATVITDFTAASDDLIWYVVNDNVMGGRSEGGFDVEDGELRFRGVTNTDGGGFSSIRSHPLDLDLRAYDGIRLRVHGDGRRYTLRLTTTARWQGRDVAYWAEFETVRGEWASVDIPFSSFEPRLRGMRLDGPELDTSRVTGLGLMIYDGANGPFHLRVDHIAAYTSRAPFSLADHRGQHRLLVASAAGSDDEQLERLIAEIGATASEFADRDLLLVVLLDAGVSSTGQRVLIPGEVAAARKALGIRPGVFAVRLIGKDGTVKFANEAATPIDDIYALIDTMPMRRRELSQR